MGSLRGSFFSRDVVIVPPDRLDAQNETFEQDPVRNSCWDCISMAAQAFEGREPMKISRKVQVFQFQDASDLLKSPMPKVTV